MAPLHYSTSTLLDAQAGRQVNPVRDEQRRHSNSNVGVLINYRTIGSSNHPKESLWSEQAGKQAIVSRQKEGRANSSSLQPCAAAQGCSDLGRLLLGQSAEWNLQGRKGADGKWIFKARLKALRNYLIEASQPSWKHDETWGKCMDMDRHGEAGWLLEAVPPRKTKVPPKTVALWIRNPPVTVWMHFMMTLLHKFVLGWGVMIFVVQELFSSKGCCSKQATRHLEIKPLWV